MRAVLVRETGGPGVLELADVPAPLPGPGELLVDVAAAGVNFMDIYQRRGGPPYFRELPFVPGGEGAGTVVAAGPGVTDFGAGDPVAWATAAGSYAEQVLVQASQAVPVPAGISLRTAAAVMLQGMTAHYLAASTYPLARGDVAVVHAAAGGVGLLLTQIARMRGATIVATASSAAKAELARQAGAQHLAGYDTFGAVVSEVTGGAGAAVVYDGVGQSTFDAGLGCLRPRGLMVLYGAASGPVPPFELPRLAAAGSLYVTRPTLGSYLASRAELLGRAGDLFGWIADGSLTVRIGGTYPLERAAGAHDDLAARRSTGKLLLLPG
ncbi:MAG TPA: quinone oxidoreductase [Streptosporangiaceae bacterium]